MLNIFKVKTLKSSLYKTIFFQNNFSTKDWSKYSNQISINDDIHLYSSPKIKLINPLKKIKSITLHNIDSYVVSVKGSEKQFFSEPLLLEWIWRLEELGEIQKELRIKKPKKYKIEKPLNTKKKNTTDLSRFVYEPTLDEGQVIGWKIIIKNNTIDSFFNYMDYSILRNKKKLLKIQYIVLSINETQVLFEIDYPVRDSKGLVNNQNYGKIRVSMFVGFGSIEETQFYLQKLGILVDCL